MNLIECEDKFVAWVTVRLMGPSLSNSEERHCGSFRAICISAAQGDYEQRNLNCPYLISMMATFGRYVALKSQLACAIRSYKA